MVNLPIGSIQLHFVNTPVATCVGLSLDRFPYRNNGLACLRIYRDLLSIVTISLAQLETWYPVEYINGKNFDVVDALPLITKPYVFICFLHTFSTSQDLLNDVHYIVLQWWVGKLWRRKNQKLCQKYPYRNTGSGRCIETQLSGSWDTQIFPKVPVSAEISVSVHLPDPLIGQIDF